MNRWFSELLVFGQYLAFFLACYASVLIVDYGFADDYFDIVSGPEGWPITKKIWEGRALYALITKIFLQFTMDIGDLRHVRFVGIIGIALVAWSVFVALVRAGQDRFQSTCVGLVIGTTLPFQLYAAWATTGPFPFAALISGLGFFAGKRAFDSPSPRIRYLLVAASISMLAAAMAIYQPAAMFFWVFVAIAVLSTDARPCDTMRRFRWYCMIGLAGIFVGFIIYKLGTSVHPNSPARAAVLDFQHIPSKVVWFLTDALPTSLRFVLLHSHAVFNMFILGIVLVFMIAGLILYLSGTFKEFLYKSGIALFLLPLSYIQNLVIVESSASYRTLSSITSLVIIYMFFAFRGYIDRLRRFRFHMLFANAIMGSLAISCAVAAAYQVRAFMVVPQFQELEFIRSHLNSKSLSRVQNIYVIRPPYTAVPYTAAPFQQREFGWVSSYPEWNARPMLFLLLREMFPEYAHISVQSVGTDDIIEQSPDSLVVDMRYFGRAVKWFLPNDESERLSSALAKLIGDGPVLSGIPIIRSRFDVYLTKNTLTYLRSSCTPIDTDETFFLHLVPVNMNDLPAFRKQYGFDSLDFEFDDRGIILGGRCIARIRLPSYPILSIRTGQYIIDQGRIWDEEFHVLD